MRQTELSFPELASILRQKRSIHRRCLVLNEIGQVMHDGGKDAPKAERVLRGLLVSSSDEDRYIAYCYLSELAKQSRETRVALVAFEGNSNNAALLAMYRGKHDDSEPVVSPHDSSLN